MPELPEVETVCRGLQPHLEGQKIVRIQQNRADLRFPIPLNLSDILLNHRITHIHRRAKYMLWDVEGGHIVLCHLGMSGKFSIVAKSSYQPQKHDHLVFETEAGTIISYNDPRRFGFVETLPKDEQEQHKLLKDIGPEPLGNMFSAPYLKDVFQGRKTSIKSALLNQKYIAGLGNIYVCEALFLAGISPKKEAGKVSLPKLELLVQAIRTVLRDAIEAGGSTLKDYAQANGELGYFQHRFKVYGREGEPCLKCAAEKLDSPPTIQRIIQQNRSTFYCATCQR